MAFYAYILLCADGTYYTGHTDDIEHRIAQHHHGYFRGCYTFSRRPLDVVWVGDFPTRYEALQSERRIKNWSKAKKKALIDSDWSRLSYLAIPPKERAARENAADPSTVRPERSRGVSPPSEVEVASVEGSRLRSTEPFDCARDERSLGVNPPFTAYMLRCSDGQYYCGHTDDLDQKLAQHQQGTRDEYTAKRLPVELVWSAPFTDRDTAFAAERRLKGWSRAKRELLIAGDEGLALQLMSRAPVARVGAGVGKGAGQPVPRELQPVIVLVRPQLGENIGKTARAMLNFGLTELRLVDPRDGWPNPSAGPTAAGANVVLEHAQVFATLAEAVADCAHVYATTVRKRGVTKPVVTPEQAAVAIHRGPGRSALVFGPERSGLETEDVALARAILTVPINPEFASLNLAQAVILCAYEWSKHVGPKSALAQPTQEEQLPPAPQAELEGMIDQLVTLLEPRDYFYPHSRADATRLTLRTILTKPGWNHLEVRTMRGVLSALGRKPDDEV